MAHNFKANSSKEHAFSANLEFFSLCLQGLPTQQKSCLGALYVPFMFSCDVTQAHRDVIVGHPEQLP